MHSNIFNSNAAGKVSGLESRQAQKKPIIANGIANTVCENFISDMKFLTVTKKRKNLET
jgi:hypothetical protein